MEEAAAAAPGLSRGSLQVQDPSIWIIVHAFPGVLGKHLGLEVEQLGNELVPGWDVGMTHSRV